MVEGGTYILGVAVLSWRTKQIIWPLLERAAIGCCIPLMHGRVMILLKQLLWMGLGLSASELRIAIVHRNTVELLVGIWFVSLGAFRTHVQPSVHVLIKGTAKFVWPSIRTRS